jgi:hypothetical protein
MIAPPHAHAHSCAKAILTDIEHLFLACCGWLLRRAEVLRRCFGYDQQMQMIGLSSSTLTIIALFSGRFEHLRLKSRQTRSACKWKRRKFLESRSESANRPRIACEPDSPFPADPPTTGRAA